ncbi:putative prenyltransferase [Fusarium bulbicola]|nr:putative prenyltransferase [Fusarium bulbicola]
MNDTTFTECRSGSSAWSIATLARPRGAIGTLVEVNRLSTLSTCAGGTLFHGIILFLDAKVLPRVVPLNKVGKLDSPSRYTSLLTDDGTPFEYSWKWNSSTSSPEIRYCIEAIGPHTGASDSSYVLGLDLTWFQHFAKAFGIEQRQLASDNPKAPKPSMFVAFEHVLKGVVVKTYFLPSAEAGSGGPPTFETCASAARGVLTSAAALNAALDVSHDTRREISEMDRGIKELGRLLSLILGRETLISWDDELEVQGVFDKCLAHDCGLYERMTYYCGIALSSKLPDLKLYMPVIRFGRSDAAVASGFGPYLGLRKRDQFLDDFVRALGGIGTGNRIVIGHRQETYLTVAFQRD